MLPTVRTRKEDGKNRVICLTSILSSSFMVLRMKKLGHFAKYFSCLQRKFFSDSSNVSERSHYI